MTNSPLPAVYGQFPLVQVQVAMQAPVMAWAATLTAAYVACGVAFAMMYSAAR